MLVEYGVRTPWQLLKGSPAILCVAWCLATGAATLSATTPEQLTDLAGDEDHPQVSPDGRHIAFSAEDDGKAGIYILDLATRGIRRVVSLPGGANRPTWSPDGKRLAFSTTIDGRGAIWVVGVDGSDPKPFHSPADASALGPDWSPDGKAIAMTRIVPDPSSRFGWGRATAWIVDADGTNPREMTTGGQEWLPHWTHDSRELIYYLGYSDDLEAVAVPSGKVTPVSGGQYVGWRPAPSPDGKSVAFVSAVARWSVWIASATGDPAPRQLTVGGDDDYPDWSPEGRWIVFSRDRSTYRTFRLDLETGRSSLVAERAAEPGPTSRGRQIAFLTEVENDWKIRTTDEDGHGMKPLEIGLANLRELAWSPFNPDLVAVIASSDRLDGRSDLYMKDLSSGKLRRLTHTGDALSRPIWCDGGRSILFSSRGGNKTPYRQIWKHKLADGSIEILTETRLNKWPTDCSRDGRKITYHKSGDETGVFTLRRSGEGWISSRVGPGSGGRWSPDGSRLAYLDRVDRRTEIFVLEADGTRRQLTHHRNVQSWPTWTADGKELIFSTRERNRNLWRIKVPELPALRPERSMWRRGFAGL